MTTTLIHGDCLEKMREMADNSVDTIITDPPYGLSFMGKKWDYDVPSIKIWQEALRVLKPGGTALIFAGSRTQHRMAVNVEDAGFILKDCIMWLYGSGFPKATDISKQLDKNNNIKRPDEYKSTTVSKTTNSKSHKGTHICNNCGKYYGSAEANCHCPKSKPISEEAKLWNGWKSHGLKPAYEPILVAMKPNDGTYANNALEWGVSGLNIDGGRIGVEERTTSFMSKSSTEAYNRDDNWKPKDGKTTVTGRFPANIILDEEAGQMLDEQSGITKSNIRKPSGGKILNPESGWNTNSMIDKTIRGVVDKGGASRFFMNCKYTPNDAINETRIGRFPANIILDEQAGQMLDEQSGSVKSGGGKKGKRGGMFGDGSENPDRVKSLYNDKGGASRFFYCSKSSRKERLLNEFYCCKIEKCKDVNMEQVVSLVKAILDLATDSLSIGGYGSRQTEAYPKECISTILTTINKITDLKTWNSLMLSPTKDFILDVFSKTTDGTSPAESVESSKELMIKIGTLIEMVGSATEDVKNATLKSLLMLKEKENWQNASSHHPTHKPLKLMEYLCTLTKTPTGGVVLDPFMGSGTTGIACKNTGREFIGIELDEEYLHIAQARINHGTA